MQRWITGGGAILQEDAVEASIVGFSHRGKDADVGGHTRKNKVLDALVAKEELKVRVREGTTAGFVDNWLSWNRIQFIDGIMADLSADEEPSQRTWRANSKPRSVVTGTVGFSARECREIGSVA